MCECGAEAECVWCNSCLRCCECGLEDSGGGAEEAELEEVEA